MHNYQCSVIKAPSRITRYQIRTLLDWKRCQEGKSEVAAAFLHRYKQVIHVVSRINKSFKRPLQEFLLCPMVMLDKCLLAGKHALLKGSKEPILPFAQSAPHVAKR